MRPIAVFLLIAIFFSACKQKHEAQTQAGTGDSVQVQAKETFDSGMYALAPTWKFYKDFDINSSKANLLIYYPQIILGDSSGYITITSLDTTYVIPEKYVIPLHGGGQISRGDYLLTWWQNGSGMQRAYVTALTDENLPVVQYLDFDWEWTDKSLQTVDTLKPDSYRKITKPLDPGSSVAYKNGSTYQCWIVLRNRDGKILVKNWSNQVKCLDKDAVLPNAVRKDLDTGQTVWIPVFGIYTYGTVTGLKNGLVDVEIDFLGNKKNVRVPALDVRTDLP